MATVNDPIASLSMLFLSINLGLGFRFHLGKVSIEVEACRGLLKETMMCL